MAEFEFYGYLDFWNKVVIFVSVKEGKCIYLQFVAHHLQVIDSIMIYLKIFSSSKSGCCLE